MRKRKGDPKAASSEERVALIMGPANEACHININHDLYIRDHYYHALILSHAVAEVWRTGSMSFDFVCAEGHCDMRITEAMFVASVWLDLPQGAPHFVRVAA